MSLKDAYVAIAELRDKALKEQQAHASLSLELGRRVTHLNGILVTLRDSVCQKCLGRGQFWVSYAQDETRMETCPQCKGTGTP